MYAHGAVAYGTGDNDRPPRTMHGLDSRALVEMLELLARGDLAALDALPWRAATT